MAALASAPGHSVDSACAQSITIDVQFEGPDSTNANSHTSLPPDPSIAAGPGFLVVVVNQFIKVYNDDGTDADHGMGNTFEQDLDTFQGFNGFCYDPRIVFDPHINRFVLSTLGHGVRVAWSGPTTDSDFPALQLWDRVVADASGWASHPNFDDVCDMEELDAFAVDRPTLGFDEDGWYASSFMIQSEGTLKTLDVFHAIEKLNDDPDDVKYYFSNEWTPEICLEYEKMLGTEVLCPVQRAQATSGTVATPLYVGVVHDGTSACSPPTPHNKLRLASIANPFGTPTFHERIIRTPACFEGETDKYQVPTTDGIWTTAGDARILDAWLRSTSSTQYLYCAHAVKGKVEIDGEVVEQIRVRWYKIDLDGWPTNTTAAPAIEDWGEIDGGVNDNGTPGDESDDAAIHLFLPAIGVNEGHDICIVMAQSSANEFTSIQAWGKLGSTGDEVGPVLIEESDVGTVLDGALGDSEFGDYFDIALEPDGTRFWVIGEVIRDGSPDFWSTYIARLEIEP